MKSGNNYHEIISFSSTGMKDSFIKGSVLYLSLFHHEIYSIALFRNTLLIIFLTIIFLFSSGTVVFGKEPAGQKSLQRCSKFQTTLEKHKSIAVQSSKAKNIQRNKDLENSEKFLPGDSKEKFVVRMIGPEDIGSGWQEIIARFEKKHPEIDIRYVTGPTSTERREDMYVRSFMGDEPVELVYMDVIWVAKFAHKGWLVPLDKWVSRQKQEEFLESTIEAGKYRGSLYRMPMRADAGMLYFRKDIIGEKPPATWEEFEHICNEYSHPPELYCFVFQGHQYEGLVCDFLEFLWGSGGEILDNDNNVIMESPESLQALVFMEKLMAAQWAPRSVLSYQEMHSLDAFQQGRAIFMRNWPYAWNMLQAEGSKLKDKIGIAPMIHAEGKTSAATLGGWGFGISSRSRNPEQAWKFIEFATGAEGQKILHFRRGVVPARKELFFDHDIITQSPHYPQLYEVLKKARPRVVHPEYPHISHTLQMHVSAVLSEIEPPAEALSNMTSTLKSIVSAQQTNWVQRLFIDRELHRSLWNTVRFVVFSVPLEFIAGFFIALLLNAITIGKGAARTSILIPWALPTAVMAMAWQFMFADPFGVINDFLQKLSIIQHPVAWLSGPGSSMFAAVFTDFWKTTPFVVIILLAGLQTIKKELYEAMAIDGAGFFSLLQYLVIPMLLPYIGIALVFRILHAAGIFDLIWVLTHGGPADRTRTIALYIYDTAFRYDDISYALFLTALIAVTLTGISYFLTRITRPRHEQVITEVSH